MISKNALEVPCLVITNLKIATKKNIDGMLRPEYLLHLPNTKSICISILYMSNVEYESDLKARCKALSKPYNIKCYIPSTVFNIYG